MATSDEDLRGAYREAQAEIAPADLDGLHRTINAIHLLYDAGKIDDGIAEEWAAMACDSFVERTQ